MIKDLEGLNYLSKKAIPLDVLRVYNHFNDIYRSNHLQELLSSIINQEQESFLEKRGEVWLRYCNIYYSDDAIIRRHESGSRCKNEYDHMEEKIDQADPRDP